MEDKDKKSLAQIFENTRVIKINATDELKKSFISYAMAVNVSRAIPDVRDGLKPVHRRILFGMGEMGVFSDKPHKKCARIVGDVMGKYHPHGDSSVYDALVRLAQPFSINEMLIDGHGNFGSVDGDSPAAMRYTEARLSKIAGEMLADIEKETVDMYPNFDDTLMQPVVLPAKFPNLLVNGADGIAVGMATAIPPHNLTEVINGVQALIHNPDMDIETLMRIIPAPDYPTGGIIMGRNALREAYRTGRGGVAIRGRAEIEEIGGRERIVITEIPYQVNKARLIIQIADLVKNKKIEGISDIQEESDREGMRIVVTVKRDHNANVVLNTLYKMTQLQISGGITFLSLVDGEPRVLNLKEMLSYYLLHRLDVLIRRTNFDLTKAQEREHIVRGLVIALAHIDEVIKTIKESSDRQEALGKLTERFELSEKQANAILEMKLAKLTSLEVTKLNEELAELTALIADYQFILENKDRQMQIIYGELEEIKLKYGTPRKTEISVDYGDIAIGDLIEREEVALSLTNGGYVKRMSISEYRSQHRGGIGVSGHKTKEDDFVKILCTTHSHNDVMFFTSRGKVFSIKVYEVPDATKQSKGRAIVNMLQLSAGEKITAMLSLPEDVKQGSLIMATRGGLIKKTPLCEYARIQRNGKIAIGLEENDELIGVQITDGKCDILIASSAGNCARYHEETVRSVSRGSKGVKAMNLREGEYIVDMVVLHEGQNSQILTISENGYGKRSPVQEFPVHGRGGRGVKCGTFNNKTGKLVSLLLVNGTEDLMLTSDIGIIIRTPVDSISEFGRASQGVRIMRLRDDAKIVSAALTEREEEENSENRTETGEKTAEMDEQSVAEINTELQKFADVQGDNLPED